MKKTKVINVSNVSGGVGKSTTVIELATYFGSKGYRCLVIDADMQASATDCIGDKGLPIHDKELKILDKQIEQGNSVLKALDNCLIESVSSDLSDVMMEPEIIEGVIQKTEVHNVYLCPSSIRLCQTDKQLTDDITRSAVNRLSIALDIVKEKYDYILIDNSPAQTLVSTNTLLASDLNIIPVKLDRKSLKGMILSLKNILSVMKRNHKEIDVKILFTMVARRGRTEKLMIPWLKEQFGDMILDTLIPCQKKPAQDASLKNKQIVWTNTTLGFAYKELGEELLRVLEGVQNDKAA